MELSQATYFVFIISIHNLECNQWNSTNYL